MEQATGTRTFSSRTRMGNWAEEICLQEQLVKDFEVKAQSGQLLSSRVAQHEATHYAPVDLARQNEDRLLRYGDVIMLYSDAGNGFVSVDTGEKLPSPAHEELYPVTIARLPAPVARGAFRIERIESSKFGRGDADIVRYEDKFALVAVEIGNSDGRFANPLYLMSQLVNPMNTSRVSGLQPVSLCEVGDRSLHKQDISWKFEFPDNDYRLEMKGQGVEVGAPILITHCRTSRCLGVFKGEPVYNDFGRGAELEVVAHTFMSVDRRRRIEQDANHFVIVVDDGSRD